MPTVATLVLGADGSTSLNGNSEGISSPADRHRFLARRRRSDALIIGGRTASSDRYKWTPVPLIILSHSLPRVLSENPKAHWWNLAPAAAVDRAKAEIGENILIEAGISIIQELLDLGRIDQLELSVTPATGGENRTSLGELLRYFSIIEESAIDLTTFYSCRIPIMMPK